MKVGMGGNSVLMGTEEVEYQKALKSMRGVMIDYYKEMDRRGYLTK